MAITVVQGASNALVNTTPLTLTFGATLTAGNSIIVIGVNDDNTNVFNNPTTPQNDTFTSLYQVRPGGGNAFGVWMASNIVGGGTTVTMVTDTFDNFAYTAYEVSGLPKYRAFDDISKTTASQATTTPVTNAYTNQFPNTLLIAAFYENSITTPTGWTAGAGYSNVKFAGQSFTSLATQTQVISAVGSNTAGITETGGASQAIFGWLMGFSDQPINRAFSTKTIRPHPFSPGIAR